MPAAAKQRAPAHERLSPSLNTINTKLARLAQATRELTAIEDAAAAELEILRDRAGRKAIPLHKKISKLEGELEALAIKHQAEVFQTGKKSLKLPAGTVGFRQTTSIEVDDKTIELIEKRGRADEAIRIKKEVIKSALHNWSAKDLKAVKADRTIADEFYCKPAKIEVEP